MWQMAICTYFNISRFVVRENSPAIVQMIKGAEAEQAVELIFAHAIRYIVAWEVFA